MAVARQFASGNLSVITQENQGASAARNKALELCQGDYVQWLDADDLLAPDKIRTSNAKTVRLSEQMDSALLRLGVLHLQTTSREVHPYATLVRSIAS